MNSRYLNPRKPSCATATCSKPGSRQLSDIHHRKLPEGKIFCSECIASITGRFCVFEKCPKARRAVKARNKGAYCLAHAKQLDRKGEHGLTPLGESYGPGPGKDLHGKASTYSNKKCRCDLCKTAWNAYCAERKAANVGIKDVGHRLHGKESTYQHGCRCEACKLGHNSYVWEQRQINILRKAMPTQATCDCCGKETEKLHTDHVHGTLHIRGLLCNSCNTGIGKLGDNLEGLLRAVDYLKRSSSDL